MVKTLYMDLSYSKNDRYIKSKVGNNPNYRLITVVLSDVEGKAKFKISGQAIGYVVLFVILMIFK